MLLNNIYYIPTYIIMIILKEYYSLCRNISTIVYHIKLNIRDISKGGKVYGKQGALTAVKVNLGGFVVIPVFILLFRKVKVPGTKIKGCLLISTTHVGLY